MTAILTRDDIERITTDDIVSSLGFTGTRHRPTDAQCNWIARHVSQADILSAHHGVCVGSDAVFHRLALMYGKHVFLHPPTNERYLDAEALNLAVFSENCTILEAKGFHERDRDIVDGCHRLLATPRAPENEDRPTSGTWYTINYARSIGKPVLICLPDGRVLAE